MYCTTDSRGNPWSQRANFIFQYPILLFRAQARAHARVSFNYQHLKNDIPVADFDSVLRAEPHTVLACLGLATYRALLIQDLPFEFGKINVRLNRYAPLTPLKELKSNLVEKYVTLVRRDYWPRY